MEFTFRAAELSDVEEWLVPIDSESQGSPWAASGFRAEMAAPDGRVLVATVAGRVVGFAVWRLLPPESELLNLAVAPSQRRRGAGRALLLQALSRAEGEGAETMHLEVRAGNAPAQRLYGSLGFAPVGRRKGYYRDNGEDAVLMRASTRAAAGLASR